MTQEQRRNVMLQQSSPIFIGAIAGFIATIPMTGFMLLMHRLLPRWQRFALPPEEIVKETADRADVKHHMDKQQILGATLISHFGYGMVMGTLYNLLTRSIPLPAFLKGMLFGLLVWTASYLGWLPMAGFTENAMKEPLHRNVLMIAAHIIWGSTTGIISGFLDYNQKSRSTVNQTGKM